MNKEGGPCCEKGFDFGRRSFILVYSSAQPVARLACSPRFILSCRASMTNGFPSRRDRAVEGEKKKKSARGMRGGIGVMDHDLTRSESD